MEHNERKRELSPAERRRRMEARRKRQEALKRKKRKRMLVILGIVAAALVIIGLIVFLITKLFSGGSETIAAKNGSFVIAIDPGHGGEDIGMSNGDVIEKQVSLEICSKLKVMLEGQGCQIVMLREDDTRLPKEERVQSANASEADLLVSVHCGYSEDGSVSGAVSHYEKDNKQSVYLAKMIEESLVKESGASNGGTKESDYSIISNTDMPSVLVEVGYISNDGEAQSLADDSYQNDIAKGIAKGIIMSLEKSE